MLPKPLYISAMDNGRFVTVEGHFVDIKTGGEEEVAVNDATVTDADISGTNGVLHVIDKVLMPVSGTLATQNIYNCFEKVVGKVHATIPKGILGCFEFTVLERNLKE